MGENSFGVVGFMAYQPFDLISKPSLLVMAFVINILRFLLCYFFMALFILKLVLYNILPFHIKLIFKEGGKRHKQINEN